MMDPSTRGMGGTSPFTDGKTAPIRALPASWYTSDEMYELERRAIFTSKWLLVTHQTRFQQTGDWVKFETAGYEFIISRDRKGQINAFHNTCRHRAYPIVEKDSGRNQILACKYHGWSYGLDGKLAKAPRYDGLLNFDKTQNGLFRIHTKIDSNGFIWVNLDASENPEPWEKDFANIDMQERYKAYNFEDYVFDHEFQLDGATNWKLCVDNFQECYHCPTSHPAIPALVDVEYLKSESRDGWTIHTSPQTEQQKRDGLQICTTYYFPNVSTNVLPHYIMLQRNKNSPQELFDLVNDMYKQIMSEDKALAIGVQKNLERGLFVNGQMHPKVESAALHLQAKMREAVKAHLGKEKAAGCQIWPARPPPVQDAVSLEDEEICASLACAPARQSVLAW